MRGGRWGVGGEGREDGGELRGGEGREVGCGGRRKGGRR